MITTILQPYIRKTGLLGFFILYGTISSYSQQKITLKQAIDSTIQNNVQIRIAQFDADYDKENLKLAKNALYPTLNGSVAGFRLYGRSLDPTTNEFADAAVNLAQGNLFASVTLFQGFQKLNAIKQNKYLLEANLNNVKKIKNDLTLTVLTTYLQLLSNRDLLKASKRQLTIAQQELERQQKFFKVGQKTLADLSQAQAQLANSESNVVNAQNEIERATLILAQLMERRSPEAYEIVEPNAKESVELNTGVNSEEIYLKSLEQYPDILLAINKRQASEKAVAIARGTAYPTLSFGAGLSTSYSDNLRNAVTTQITGAVPIGIVQNTNATVVAPTFLTQSVAFGEQIKRNFNQVIGFTMVIPLINGSSSRIGIRKAKIRYQTALAEEELAKLNLSKVVSEAVWDVQATNKKYKANQVKYKAAADAFKVIQQRYSVGLADSQDLNIALTSVNIAEFTMIQSKYDVIFKNKLIDYYLGNQISF
ncbi:TolC family protein [Mucilaginibacter calamicampi]|uniref:TolC family protein n=1 Tax=Mucilaginibacter calamicampi TaxID=1302352 RepID=A0ABW2YZI6_9SPHI